MAIADLQTDWSLLSKLLRLAQSDGWTIAFGNDRVLVSNRRTGRGVVVLPASLIAHARRGVAGRAATDAFRIAPPRGPAVGRGVPVGGLKPLLAERARRDGP
jgi:hypothetical protein